MKRSIILLVDVKKLALELFQGNEKEDEEVTLEELEVNERVGGETQELSIHVVSRLISSKTMRIYGQTQGCSMVILVNTKKVYIRF